MSENRRILHIVKTLDGATWAYHQIRGLIQRGWDVHVAAPMGSGRHLNDLLETGAKLHVLPVEYPVTRPWQLPSQSAQLRQFVQTLNPALIHSHFVSTTLMARSALKEMNIPRIFQVPGPLHLEQQIFGQWDIFSADHDDHWVASSEFIKRLYLERYYVPADRVSVSYYGIDVKPTIATSNLREKFSIPKDSFLLGNVSYFYPPKAYLGQRVGIKGHELMLEAIEKMLVTHPKLWAVFIGGPWKGADQYYQQLRQRAERIGRGRIVFTGTLPQAEVLSSWREIDLALHIPFSENCGGVVEPLLVGTPVLASSVGGLPEVVIPGKTGLLSARAVEPLLKNLTWALENPIQLNQLALKGQQHVVDIFSRDKTAEQIDALYQRLLSVSSEKQRKVT